MDPTAAVDLYWLPLGAGAHSVRLNGRVYEWVLASWARREPCDLYHAGLEVLLDGRRHVIEMTPVPPGSDGDRGVVVQAPVGVRWLGRWRLFRYEVHCWPDGQIPDVEWAVDSPRRVALDPGTAHAVIDRVAQVPPLVWGRDELRLGDMWNSNSVVAWLLAGAGVDPGGIGPPPRGRAPGWDAGLALARREAAGRSAGRL